ncbi:MAG: hypothetical protein KGQ59_08420 [Bdellovibrionales bacterium]|nr:hypothetical protein [Bdellovibrionales bacterium]
MNFISIESHNEELSKQNEADWSNYPLKGLISIPYPGQRKFWIARIHGDHRPVGRIGACLSRLDAQRGLIGFFDLHPDLTDSESKGVADTLLNAACSFLSEMGAHTAVGPIHYNTWFPYRFLLETQDKHRFNWEPLNPPLWPKLWIDFGFEIESTFASEGYSDLKKFCHRIQPYHQQALSRGFRFDPINPDRLITDEIPKLHDLSMKCFADAPFFEPVPLDLFKQLYIPLADKSAQGQLQYSCFIVSPENKPIGFSFNFAQDRRLILKTIGILPEYRGLGLSNAAMFPGVEKSTHEGLSEWITALVRTGAQSESYARKLPPQWRHTYALFSKQLSKI